MTGVPPTRTARVLELQRLSTAGYALVLERDNLIFRAGQLINLHGRDTLEHRSYTICSGENDPQLTVLFRHIPSGVLTPQLLGLRPGDRIEISGPYGEFVVRDRQRPLWFFATGTGVAPCRAYHRSYPGLDLTLVHGVRRADDLFYREEWRALTYIPCLTADPGTPDVVHGRVTDVARARELPADAHYYLCGANEMIYEMQEILAARGIDRGHIFTEAYYYRSDDA